MRSRFLRKLFHASGPLGQAQLRRHFLKTAAFATGATLSGPARAVCSGLPNHIPHVFSGMPFGLSLHFFFPGPVEGVNPDTGHDPSLITDFNGFIGIAEVAGQAVGKNTATNAMVPYTYTADLRFMMGEFIDCGGQTRRGAFAFI
ncbi:MAG: hypothetical protein HY013_00570 [Candidatus Solibacter usitatus]|nr:hypothetical protein [Candidatus Solibacter usitatus]